MKSLAALLAEKKQSFSKKLTALANLFRSLLMFFLHGSMGQCSWLLEPRKEGTTETKKDDVFKRPSAKVKTIKRPAAAAAVCSARVTPEPVEEQQAESEEAEEQHQQQQP